MRQTCCRIALRCLEKVVASAEMLNSAALKAGKGRNKEAKRRHAGLDTLVI